MKKGFTLAEVMAVVIILGILVILAFPQILKLVKDTEEKLDSATVEIIKVAAKSYVTDNLNDFSKTDKKYCIDAKTLIENEKLEASDKYKDICVKVSYNHEYTYDVYSKCKCEE